MELSDEAVASFRTLGDIVRHISRWLRNVISAKQGDSPFQTNR